MRADGRGVVGHAGARLLADVAKVTGPAGGSPTFAEARQSSAAYPRITARPELDVVGRRFVIHLRHRELDPFRANPRVASLASFRHLVAQLTRVPVTLSTHSE
ncbi:hypothetical protein [Micromonospora sp. NPDC049374]|uniref:hypothetical protein n=1 Tax=Micromonospora sp. NPDC049374 TaxID=3154352 RepID=UPI00343DF0D4